METELCDGMPTIVSKFTQLVKSLMEQAEQVQSPDQVRLLEQSVRDQGRSILQSLLQQVLQSVVDRRQESLRTCPQCASNRRHQGVRSRRLDSSLGRLVLRGIYWKCPNCFWHQHSVDCVGDEPVTLLMKDLMVLAGVSSTSFDKAQIVTRHLLGVDADDEAIRHLCLKAGGGPEQSRIVVTPVSEGGELIGSCDGTMINTREDRWREVKALRFEHAGGSYAAAYLENAASFVPRLKKAAERLGGIRAGRCVFVSDCAEWITQGVREQLPSFVHVADYFHACQHVHTAGEAVYGREHPDARKWSGSMSRRLREQGAAKLAGRLRRLALFYADLKDQRAVLDLCRYLDKHAAKMDYPRFEREEILIHSGLMESFCKQLGLRLKGPGMRWSVRNLSAMATLVSRWAVDPERYLNSSHAA